MMKYSVVIPVFNEAQSIEALVDRIDAVFVGMKEPGAYEILFVDDGSTDDTRGIIRNLCARKSHVHGIFLRRNLGKAFALSAGFAHAKGDYVITMDGDLQDRPEEIPKLVAKLAEGYDLVTGWKQKRKDARRRLAGSWVFNFFVSKTFGLRLHDFNCGFKILRKAVIKNILVYGQHHRFIPVLAHFLGFKVAEVPVIHDQRVYGVSKYPVFRYQGFFDLVSLLFIHRFRFSPLYFFGTVGLILIIPSMLVIGTFTGRIVLWMIGVMAKPDISFSRPILALSTAALIMGLHIFLTGFVCDFILHHQSRKNILDTLETMVDDIV